VRRRRLPFELRAPASARTAAEGATSSSQSAAAGQTSGLPRFLNAALAGAASDPAAVDEATSADTALGPLTTSSAAPTRDEETAAAAPPVDISPDDAQQVLQEQERGADDLDDVDDVDGELPVLPDDAEPALLPDVSGVGVETELTAYSLTLRGLTTASFSNSFTTANVRTRQGTECDGCSGAECVKVSGTLVSTFSVTTEVSLPSVDDFPDLTACQRQRVRAAINNVLAPHEQRHVRAFRTYNGTVRTPFSFTICRSDFDSRMQDLHDSVEATRRSAVQAASDALDPFQFDVDLDCE
jgi:hypothetical protein